jgi:phage repressor protein C with HTH and peptisase S24 domain
MQIEYNKTSKKESMSLKTLGKNIAFLMGKTGIDPQTLSDSTGVGVATINNLKRCSGNPTISTLSALAEFFNVSAGALMETDLSGPSSGEKVKTLPLINFNDLELYLQNNKVYKNTYSVEVDELDNRSLFAVEITTNSLFPEIESGTICVISQDNRYYDGDIVLLKTKNSHIFFRRIFIASSGFKFSNISLDKNTEIVEYENYTIIGVVLKKINKLR